MRASQIISRARRPAASALATPVPAAIPVTGALAAAPQQQVQVRPPQIPPMTPPRAGSSYRQLMKKHDRMGTRHLT